MAAQMSNGNTTKVKTRSRSISGGGGLVNMPQIGWRYAAPA
jgi:hypothetical protein